MFIFASSKEWHNYTFQKIISESGISGVYVDSTEKLLDALKEFGRQVDWVFFGHWSKILSEDLCKSINGVIFHCTDLPYGRGGSPLQNLIREGHSLSQLCAIRLVPELDSGDILRKTAISLGGTAEEIFLKMRDPIADMCISILNGDYSEVPQTGKVTVFKRRTPGDSNLNILEPSSLSEFHDLVRMLDCKGYPSCFLEFGKFRFEFSRSALMENEVKCDVKISIKS